MSENKHTPGPWLIDVDNYHAGHIASVATSDGPGPRFEIWSMNWPTADQCEGNARLIAAAPEMYSLIEQIAEGRNVAMSDAAVIVRKVTGR